MPSRFEQLALCFFLNIIICFAPIIIIIIIFIYFFKIVCMCILKHLLLLLGKKTKNVKR